MAVLLHDFDIMIQINDCSHSFSNEAVEEHLEHCVKNGSIAKVINKGLTSYRDPGSAPGRGQKTLHITAADMDLTKVQPKLILLTIFFQLTPFTGGSTLGQWNNSAL